MPGWGVCVTTSPSPWRADKINELDFIPEVLNYHTGVNDKPIVNELIDLIVHSYTLHRILILIHLIYQYLAGVV